MKNVYSSPSSIVFIILALALCVFVYVGKVSEANFILLAGLCFQHYFRRGDTKSVDKPLQKTEELG